MKKLMFLIIAIVALGLIVSGCLPVVPPAEQEGEVSSLKQPGNNNGNNNDKPPSGAHFNLNIIGKKSDWSGGGGYNNPDRHTMFVPENTDEFMLEDGSHCYTPSGTPCWAPEGANYHDPRLDYPGITIWMTQYPKGTDEDEFAVLDGNAFDDCKLEFQLKSGTYTVWIVAKAKPAKKDEPDYYTDITGWIRYTDELTGTIYYYLEVGKVTVKKKWQNVTDELFMYGGEWVFTYLAGIEADPLYEEAAYFWQFDNKGNKLVKVRFYKD